MAHVFLPKNWAPSPFIIFSVYQSFSVKSKFSSPAVIKSVNYGLIYVKQARDLTGMKVRDITFNHIEKFKRHLLGVPLDKKTVNCKIDTVSRLLHLAQDNGVIMRVPKIVRFKIHQKHPEFLTKDEKERLLAASMGEDQMMWLTAMETGVRVS